MNYFQQAQAVSQFRKDYGIHQTRRKYMKGNEAELRTKKNDYLALNWDELGNVLVLTAKGVVIQLIGNEYKGA